MKEQWEIIVKAPVLAFLETLTEIEVEKVLAMLNILSIEGPNLARPYTDTIIGSKYPNLKELRVSAKNNVFRIFYIFDPQRKAIVLCGGNKKGKTTKLFYQTMIKEAELIYQQHLEEMIKCNKKH